LFYLGTHRAPWLWSGAVDFPLFINNDSLFERKTFGRAIVPWALDSGGYSTLSRYGRWNRSPRQYVSDIARYDREIGNLDWAAPQDWMCEHHVLRKTGLTEAAHQIRTTVNFTTLRELWPHYSDDEDPIMPVIQAEPGNAKGYFRHIDMYTDAGVDLWKYKTVGVGTVCRIQSSKAILQLAKELNSTGLKLHWFGVKTAGIRHVWPRGNPESFASFDSMAWSAGARYKKILLPGCTGHINCANCAIYATKWREENIIRTVQLLRNNAVTIH
jgi:hypothetical protein